MGQHDPMTNAVGQAISGEDERGLGATLIGGSGGAFLGKKLGGGGLGTMGGGILGAVAANVLDHKYASSLTREMRKTKY